MLDKNHLHVHLISPFSQISSLFGHNLLSQTPEEYPPFVYQIKERWEILKLNKKPKVASTLHTVSWLCIICDEAYMIKDRSTSTTKAVFNLIS